MGAGDGTAQSRTPGTRTGVTMQHFQQTLSLTQCPQHPQNTALLNSIPTGRSKPDLCKLLWHGMETSTPPPAHRDRQTPQPYKSSHCSTSAKRCHASALPTGTTSTVGALHFAAISLLSSPSRCNKTQPGAGCPQPPQQQHRGRSSH